MSSKDKTSLPRQQYSQSPVLVDFSDERERRKDVCPQKANTKPSYLIDQCAHQLTTAIMNRLQIPEAVTIVGLLNVGPSEGNYDELLRWVTRQLPSLENRSWDSAVDELSKRVFRVLENSMCG